MGCKPIQTPGAALLAAASAVGRMEAEGPLGGEFDLRDTTDRFGQKTFEKSESEMQRISLATAMGKLRITAADIGALFAGDLLNQCVGSAYGLLQYDIPYFGLYGACSTAAEGLALASVFVSHDICTCSAVVTSSHNASAERQYRTPLEYGGQRTPTAQWTVTGAGAFIVGCESDSFEAHALIREVMPGIVVEKGVNDANNMGAAMAPAAAYTIGTFLKDMNMKPSDFDCIVTGDLGLVGSALLHEVIFEEYGFDIQKVHKDCGVLMFDIDKQDVHAGGSGCGCSASVLCGYFLPKIKSGEIKDMLFIATGALMSTTASQQGESIPSIAHLVHISHNC